MDKQAIYKKMVDNVNKCSLCDGTTALSRDKTQRIGLQHAQISHVNLWSFWQGNLSPEILVIGQDWGKLPNNEKMNTFTNSAAYRINIAKEKNTTDYNLVKLFSETFSIDILAVQKLFFTNSVFCYKKGNLNESVRISWFSNCNMHYMSELILLLEPKCIITLGIKALHGLAKSGNIYSDGSLVKKIYRLSLKVVLQDPNQLWWEALNKCKRVRLFPVFHPGRYSSRNRPFQQQLHDWKRIKPFVSL